MLTGVCVLLAAATCGIVRAERNAEELRVSVTDVSLDLFKAVTAGTIQNRVLSPISVNILLALLEQGAKGQSGQQLQTALRMGHQQLKEGYGWLSENLQRAGSKDVQLDVANCMFVGDGFPLQQEFLQTATRDFYSEVKNVTFGSGDASSAINAWVAETTHGKITNLVEPVLPAGTVMVLANAIYFKSPWLRPFKKAYTAEKTFSVDHTKNVSVPFMFQEDSFQTGSNDELGVKWVELYFKGETHSLLVVLPNERFGLAGVLDKMTSSEIHKMLQDGTEKGVRLYLPRFSLGSNTKLVPALKKLGITDVFEVGRSDLSGVSSSKEPLSVSDVLQKATMEIDEDGGVASAATEVQIVPLSSVVYLDPVEFHADHPFAAIIVDKIRNVPLFIATIADPTMG